MTTYTIDAADSTTEATWLAYKDAQQSLRDQVGTAYRAVSVALEMYAAMRTKLTPPDGEFATVAPYHVARATAILTKEQELLGLCAEVLRTAEEMQYLSPEQNLFPGVTKRAPVEENAE